MASGHTGNVVPRKGLRVRISCPPLFCIFMATCVFDVSGFSIGTYDYIACPQATLFSSVLFK